MKKKEIAKKKPVVKKEPLVKNKPAIKKALTVKKVQPAKKSPVIKKQPPMTKKPIVKKAKPVVKKPIAKKQPPMTKKPTVKKAKPAPRKPIVKKQPPNVKKPIVKKVPVVKKKSVVNKKPAPDKRQTEKKPPVKKQIPSNVPARKAAAKVVSVKKMAVVSSSKKQIVGKKLPIPSKSVKETKVSAQKSPFKKEADLGVSSPGIIKKKIKSSPERKAPTPAPVITVEPKVEIPREVVRPPQRRVLVVVEEEIALSDFDRRILTAEGYRRSSGTSGSGLKGRKK